MSTRLRYGLAGGGRYAQRLEQPVPADGLGRFEAAVAIGVQIQAHQRRR